MNNEIKELMLEAIRYSRPDCIQKVCLPIWNQPFFYKIDRAHALTISYNPTDRGARTNYPEQVARYKKNGFLEAEEIFELLYNFKKENYWRKYFDLLFNTLGIKSENIAHMDASFFPYRTFNDYLNNKNIDDTNKFLRKTISLLYDKLKFIFIDGAKNKDLVKLFVEDYTLIDTALLPINSGVSHRLYIYKHKEYSTFLIYYECFLYGVTCPSEYSIKKLAEHINAIVNDKGVLMKNIKLCPKCELNYLKDGEELCELCREKSNALSGGSQAHKPRSPVYFNENFTFTNERSAYKSKTGFKAYNSNGDNAGIVFMTDDRRSPSFGYCELGIYPQFQNRYGEWHRFTVNGVRLKWETLCKYLASYAQYSCHID